MSEHELIDTNSIGKLDPSHIFTDLNPTSPITGIVMERDHVIDVRDPKWGHPDAADIWLNPAAESASGMYSQDLTDEVKIANAEAATKMMLELFARAPGEGCEVKEYMVPGCPEEPETQAKVLVYTPEGLKEHGNNTIFYVIGGGLVTCEPSLCGLENYAKARKTVLVTVVYRTSLKATYPAALNDCHAGYQWMVEHADEIGVDPDKVVITGSSSGGHLSLCLGFRLKRYGYRPRGIVADLPQTGFPSETPGMFGSTYFCGVGDASQQHDFLAQYLGRNTGNPMVGPEALPNYATVEDCIGYPPCVIHTAEFDSDVTENRKFFGKLLNARGYTEYHCWGAFCHGLYHQVDTPIATLIRDVISCNVDSFFEYDFRRPWIIDEYRKMINAKLDAMS